MIREKTYSAFTLVEMLIVMGIVVILMAVGISSGRFAIQRANKIEHQNSADQIYQGLQSYYTDNREFPDEPTEGGVETLVTTTLADYIDEFDGGSDATYYYAVDTTNQEILVCVSLGGLADANNLGFYCNGNGFGSLSTNITVKEIAGDATNYDTIVTELGSAFVSSSWEAATPW